jgi:hypothetical protein
MKPGHQTTEKARVIWSDESSFTLFPTSGRVYSWRTPKEAYNQECLVPTVNHGDGFGNVWVAILWYFVCSIITVYVRITAREYVEKLGNQVHPMIQTLFPNNVLVFQDNGTSIYTAGTVQSLFEEHEGELQHRSIPLSMALQPFGPWPLFQFLNPVHSR